MSATQDAELDPATLQLELEAAWQAHAYCLEKLRREERTSGKWRNLYYRQAPVENSFERISRLVYQANHSTVPHDVALRLIEDEVVKARNARDDVIRKQEEAPK